MTICTPHSYAGPKECPYCRIAELEAQNTQLVRRKREELDWAEREKSIARAVAELENEALQPSARIKRAREALR